MRRGRGLSKLMLIIFPQLLKELISTNFRTVRARIAVALVVLIKIHTNHIFFKNLIIPDYGFEPTKTIYLNVFRNWNALCKSTRLHKSCSTPAEINGRKQLTMHSLLNTFHQKTVSQIFDKCVCFSFISK